MWLFRSPTKGKVCNHTRFFSKVKRSFSRNLAAQIAKKDFSLKCKECSATSDDADVWLCVQCCTLLCAQEEHMHVSSHSCSGNCGIYMHTRDLTIFCTTCQCYLYPREVAGHSDFEGSVDFVVAEWLGVLGKMQRWWNDDLPHNRSASGRHGLSNFGNTCFFTSTVQCLLHLPPPVFEQISEPPPPPPPPPPPRVAQAPADEAGAVASPSPPRITAVASELAELHSQYWGAPLKGTDTLAPRNLWNAVSKQAVFGVYDEVLMEDANSLLFDVLSGLGDRVTEPLCGISIQTSVHCQVCDTRRASMASLLTTMFAKPSSGSSSSSSSSSRRLKLPPLLPELCCIIAEFVVGEVPRRRTCETILSLPITGHVPDVSSPPSPAPASPVHCSSLSSSGPLAGATTTAGAGDAAVSDLPAAASSGGNSSSSSPSTPVKGAAHNFGSATKSGKKAQSAKSKEEGMAELFQRMTLGGGTGSSSAPPPGTPIKDSGSGSGGGGGGGGGLDDDTAKDNLTLEQMLAAFFAPEFTTDYKCEAEACKCTGQALNRSYIVGCGRPAAAGKALCCCGPDVLVIQIKRFVPVDERVPPTLVKCHTRVSIPVALNIAELGLAQPGATLQAGGWSYELTGMVVHDGGLGGGHYMAYTRGGAEDEANWMWWSDQFFGGVSEAKALQGGSADPYILFYRRVAEE